MIKGLFGLHSLPFFCQVYTSTQSAHYTIKLQATAQHARDKQSEPGKTGAEKAVDIVATWKWVVIMRHTEIGVACGNALNILTLILNLILNLNGHVTFMNCYHLNDYIWFICTPSSVLLKKKKKKKKKMYSKYKLPWSYHQRLISPAFTHPPSLVQRF